VDILSIFWTFNTQEQCIAYLEQKRWGGDPQGCIYCGSVRVGRHASGDRESQRWQCQDCHASFSVTVGTIFQGTHIPLQNWFLVLGLMLNAKKAASAYQIARDIGMRRPTVWSMMHRIRVAIAKDQDQGRFLYGIVEADETCVGAKPRKGNKKSNRKMRGPGSGRGTKKAVSLGAVKRGGRVVARHAKGTSGRVLNHFLSRHIDRAGTLLITDEWQAKGINGCKGNWAMINHESQYADGAVQTNTIEGFWSLLKHASYGQRHRYSVTRLPLCLAEAAYKYNHRTNAKSFESLVGAMVSA